MDFSMQATQTFPVSTTVYVYLAKNRRDGQAPGGSAVTSSTMTATGVTFSGLAEETAYAAYALLGGVHTYVGFRTRSGSEAPGATAVYTPEGVPLLVATRSTALGNKSLTLAGAAVALSTVSGGIPTGATRFVFVPTVDVRYTDDGATTPTSSVGIPVQAGQPWFIDSDLSDVSFYGPAGAVNGGFYS
jgi:hypothetical protein